MTVLIQDLLRTLGAAGQTYFLPGIDVNIAIANNNNGVGASVTVEIMDIDGSPAPAITIPPYLSQFLGGLWQVRRIVIQGSGANISIVVTDVDEEVRVEPISVVPLSQFPTSSRVIPLYSRLAPGRVLVSDDFEAATLKWFQNSGTVTRDTTASQVYEGAAAMKMVTGAVAGNAAEAARRIGAVRVQRHVVELYWAMNAAAITTPRRFFVRFLLRSTNVLNDMTVAYLKNLTTPQNKWQSSGDGATFVDIPGASENILCDTTAQSSFHYLRAHFTTSADNVNVIPTLDELHTDLLDLTNLRIPVRVVAGGGSTWSDLIVHGDTDIAAASTFTVDAVIWSGSEV